MIVRAVDVNNDWVFGKGKSSYKRDNDAVAQNVGTALRCFQGDCFFDIADGIDWFNGLGSKDVQGLVLSIRARILSRDNVRNLIQADIGLDERRRLTVSYKLLSTFSTTPLEGSTGVPGA